ncbi:hypothetical protein JL722_4437 [Aureococcus anophagefferens]|nr:hypothetical protein JL722_4437 [Aureococcus anophagefferens]
MAVTAARDAMLATEEPVAPVVANITNSNDVSADSAEPASNATNATNPATDANPAAAAPPAAPPAPRPRTRRRSASASPCACGPARRALRRARRDARDAADGDGRSADFDGVLGQAATQAEVYDATAASLVARVFEGYNATVMAYGQTGSGKTHTMGEPLDALSTSPGDAGEGVIGRALGEVFARRAASPEATTVHLSYLEVYNECVYDLLATHEDREPLGVREDGARSSCRA